MNVYKETRRSDAQGVHYQFFKSERKRDAPLISTRTIALRCEEKTMHKM